MLTEYNHLTMDQLYLLFRESSWKTLTDGQCIAALQEMENRIAAREGRPAMEVRLMSKEHERPGLNGFFVDGTNVLHLSRRLIEKRKSTIFGITAGEALNTVLHEGRHAYQFEAVHGRIKGVSRATMLTWGVSLADYHSGQGGMLQSAMYFGHPVEVDARHFARRNVEAISRRITQLTGAVDRGFAVALAREKVQESAKCMIIRQNLTKETLDVLEARAKVYYRMAHPDADLSEVKLYKEARWMIEKNGDVDDMDKYLDKLDSERMAADEAPDSFDKLLESVMKEREAAANRTDNPDAAATGPRPDGRRRRGF